MSPPGGRIVGWIHRVHAHAALAPPPPQVREAALELGYQPDETFCLKVRAQHSRCGASMPAAPLLSRLRRGPSPARPPACLPQVSQLREIFEVRWSVFLLGPAGCGKTAIWRTLMRAQNNFGEKTVGGAAAAAAGTAAQSSVP